MSVARFLVLLAMVAAPAYAAAQGACAAEKFSSNRVFATCSDLPRLGASVHWTYDAAASSLSVAFVAEPPSAGGWVAWGLNPNGDGIPNGDGMAGAQALVAAPKDPGGSYVVQTYSISGYLLGSPGRIAYPTSDLAAELGGDGRVRLFGNLKLQNGTGEVNQVWQVGPVSGGSIAPHAMGSDNLAAKGKLVLAGKAAAGAAPTPPLAPEAGSYSGAASSLAPSAGKSPSAAVTTAGVSAPALLVLTLLGFLATVW